MSSYDLNGSVCKDVHFLQSHTCESTVSFSPVDKECFSDRLFSALFVQGYRGCVVAERSMLCILNNPKCPVGQRLFTSVYLSECVSCIWWIPSFLCASVDVDWMSFSPPFPLLHLLYQAMWHILLWFNQNNCKLMPVVGIIWITSCFALGWDNVHVKTKSPHNIINILLLRVMRWSFIIKTPMNQTILKWIYPPDKYCLCNLMCCSFCLGATELQTYSNHHTVAFDDNEHSVHFETTLQLVYSDDLCAEQTRVWFYLYYSPSLTSVKK